MGKKKKNIRMLLFVSLVLLLIVGSYHSVHRIILSSDIEMIKEISVHDTKALSNVLLNEWNSLDILCDTMQRVGAHSDKEVINFIQGLAKYKGDSNILLVSSDGMFYQSDGVIHRQEGLYDVIKAYDKTFAFAYDFTDGLAVEQKREYLLIGKKIHLSVAGHTFVYVARKAQISEFDGLLDIHSFGGEGYSGVIDKDGDFVIWRNRTANVVVRDNLFDRMKTAEYGKENSYEKVRDALKNSVEGTLTFNVRYDKTEYIMNITELKDTQWYYVALVPKHVFSNMTYRLMVVIWFFSAVIISLVFLYVYRDMKFHRVLQKETMEHNKEIEKALKAAEHANQAKSVFLRSMSHDIRTPMNAICGFTELAVVHIEDKKRTVDYLNKIRQSSEHLMNLLNDILDMSRIESGSISIHTQAEQLTVLLWKIKDLFLAEMEKREQTLIWNDKGIRNDWVMCDGLRLSQILINIISNAMKYTKNGGTISFEVFQEMTDEKEKGIYEFRIKDNGIGMSEEFLENVFEPFSREPEVMASGIQGTGLGMSITKSLVELMEGTIECQSIKDVGTEIRIWIPFSIVEEKMEDRKEEEITETINFAGKKILLAEDSPLNQELTVILLEEMGFVVDVVNNGKEACDLLILKGGGYYDLILMDIQMPDMDGYEAAKTIRRLKDRKLAEITICAMTANAFEDEREKVFDAGMDGYMAKPVKVELLAKMLQKNFRERRGKRCRERK